LLLLRCHAHPLLLLLLLMGCQGRAGLMQHCAARQAQWTTWCAESHHSRMKLHPAEHAWPLALQQQHIAWLHHHAQG
jgi:hypothetical protein